MAITREMILKAVEGKAAERGQASERKGDLVVITYPEPQTAREDDLHKQSIRALVKRMAPDWKIHLNTIGSIEKPEGFTVEVRPAPSTDDGPVQGRSPKDTDRIDRIEQMLRQLSEELATLKGN